VFPPHTSAVSYNRTNYLFII